MKKIMRMMLVFFLLITSNVTFVNAASDTLTLNTTIYESSDSASTNLSIQTGKNFIVGLSYAVVDITNNYENAYIRVTFPDGVNYVGYSPNPMIRSHRQVSANQYEFQIGNSDANNVINAGSTGKLEIEFKLDNDGSISDGTDFVIQSEIDAISESGTPSTTPGNDVTVTSTGSTSYWITDKSVSSSELLVDGLQVNYRVRLRESSSNQPGRIGIVDPIIVDTYPENAVVVDADGGVVDAGLRTITWTLSGTFYSTQTFNISLKYPDASFSEGDNIINNVNVTSTNVGPLSDSASVTYTGPVVSDMRNSFSKYATFNYRHPGQYIQYRLRGIRNDGSSTNVPIQNFIISDELPYAVEYTTITSAFFQQAITDSIPYTFEYRVNGDAADAWRTEDISGYLSGNSFNVTSLTAVNNNDVHTGAYLIAIRITIPELPLGYSNDDVTLGGTVRNHTSDGSAIVLNPNDVGFTVSNTASFSYDGDGTTFTTTKTDTFQVKPQTALISLNKSASSGPFVPENTVSYTITVRNQNGATGIFDRPVVYDYLPRRFDFDLSSVSISGPAGMDKDDFDISFTTDLESNDRTAIKFALRADAVQTYLDINEAFTITYDATIRQYTNSATNFENEVWTTSQTDKRFLNSSTVAEIFNGIVDYNDTVLLRDDVSVTVINYDHAAIELWTKGELDTVFKRYDNSEPYDNAGLTVSGGTADYKVVIKNEGNTKLEQIRLLDILPFIGDTGVVSDQNRNSEWRPNLLEALTEGDGIALTYFDELGAESTISADVEIFYSESSDRNVVSFDHDIVNDSVNWMDSVPANYDITSIQSLYFIINNFEGANAGLEPGESIELSWKMRAPLLTPSDYVAWNSIASQMNTNNSTLSPSEPLKVGFRVTDDHRGQVGDFIWFDSNKNGVQDDGHSGTNAGINGISVELYHASSIDGTYTKVDSTKTADDHNGNPGTYLFPNLPGSPSDLSRRDFYYVKYIIPEIYDITSSTETLEAVNGSENLLDSNGALNGARCATDSIPGYKVICTEAFELQETPADYPFPYRRHGVDLGLTHAAGVADFTITKTPTAVLEDNSLDPTTDKLTVGDTVEYLVTITNTGSVPLNDLKIEDVLDRNQSGFTFTTIGVDQGNMVSLNAHPKVESITNSGTTPEFRYTSLAVGEVLYVKGIYQITSDDYDQTAVVNTIRAWSNETHADDTTDPYTDDALVDVSGFTLSKVATETEVYPDLNDHKTVHYNMTVTNTSSVTLTNIELTDNDVTSFTNIDNVTLSLSGNTVTIASLAPGASIDITAEYESTSVNYDNKINNTATITHPDVRDDVSDSVSVDVVALEVVKTNETVKVEPYAIGDVLTYQIVVTNRSSKALTNVNVADLLYNKADGANFTNIDSYIIANLAKDGSDANTITYTLTADDFEELPHKVLKNKVKLTYGEIDEEMGTDVNLGLREYNYGYVGDLVWFDSNGNGTQDDGHSGTEAGINGITVELYHSTDDIDGLYSLVGSTTTADDPSGNPGFYSFNELAGTSKNLFRKDYYYIKFIIPENFTITASTEALEGVNGVENLTDSNGALNGARCSSDSVAGHKVVCTEAFELRETDPDYPFPYTRHGVDLGLRIASGSANFTVNKQVVAVVEDNTLNPVTDPLNLGETAEYLITIENIGTIDLTDIKLQDVMDRNQNGFMFTEIGTDLNALIDVNTSPNVLNLTNTGSTPELTYTSLATGQTLYVKGRYQITADDYDQTAVENTINVWSNETHSDGMDPYSDGADVEVSGFTIEKTATETEVYPNSSTENVIHYNIRVTNTSSVTLTDIILTDDTVTSFTNLDGVNLVLENDKVKITSLAVGAFIDVTASYVTSEADYDAKVVNTATISHPQVRNGETDTASVDVIAVDVVKENVTVKAAPYAIDDVLTFKISVANRSSKDLTGINVKDLLYNREEGNAFTEIYDYTIATLTQGAVHEEFVNYTLTLEDFKQLYNRELVNKVKIEIGDLDDEVGPGSKIELEKFNSGQVGDFIWFDSNNNGIQDDGHQESHAGINGVVVKLYIKGDVSASRFNRFFVSTSDIIDPSDVDGYVLYDSQVSRDNPVTGTPGYYLFDNLPQGSYYVEYVLPLTYDVTISDPNLEATTSTSEDNTDSNAGYDGIVLRTEPFGLSYREATSFPFKREGVDLGVTPKEAGEVGLVIEKSAKSVVDSSKDPMTEYVYVNQTVVYEVKLENTGTVALNNVRVQDILDREQDGFNFTRIGTSEDNMEDVNSSSRIVAVSNSGAYPELTIDYIDPGEVIYVQGTYKLHFLDEDGTTLDNTVYVWSDEIHSDTNVDPLTSMVAIKVPEPRSLPNTGAFDYSIFYLLAALFLLTGMAYPFKGKKA